MNKILIKFFQTFPITKGLYKAEIKYVESSNKYISAGNELVNNKIDENEINSIELRHAQLINVISKKDPDAKASKKTISDVDKFHKDSKSIILKLEQQKKRKKDFDLAKTALIRDTKNYEKAYKKFYLFLIPLAIPVQLAFPEVGQLVHMNFYLVLAQIFPILFFALFIERKIKRSERSLISKGLIPSRDSYHQFDGFLSFTFGEILCLIAISLNKSSTFFLYLIVMLLIGYFAEIYKQGSDRF